jgi:hypothetical protein
LVFQKFANKYLSVKQFPSCPGMRYTLQDASQVYFADAVQMLSNVFHTWYNDRGI